MTNGSRQHKSSAKVLAATQHLGLRYVTTDTLSIRRRRCGKGWTYLGAGKRIIRDPKTVRRLARLAVPPAYHDVLYASDPAAHLQAIGRDAAGRLQYRYIRNGSRCESSARRVGSNDSPPRCRASVGA